MSVYKIFVEQKISQFNFVDIFSVIKKYGLTDTINENVPFFATENGDTKSMFFGNLHFYYVSNEKETSLRIFIKSPSEEWDFGESFRPNNETLRIYIKYDVEVMGIKSERWHNEIYKSGNWDKYVLHTLSSLCKTVDGVTKYAKLQKAYKN